MKGRAELIVFSDLDGTLLAHDSYSWARAAPALARLRALGAGLVLATSKTAAEVAPLRAEIGFADWPAIVENGSGLLEPGADGDGDDSTYRQVRAVLRDLPPGFRGFGDMSESEVSALTGLDAAGAARARTRRFSEPGLWAGDEAALAEFGRAAFAAGLMMQKGGRFISLSLGGTKAERMAELIVRLAPRHTIALGDAPNDIAMLEAAQHAVIVANSNGTGIPPLPGEATGRIRRTAGEGPKGWAEAMEELLAQLNLKEKGPRDG